MEIKLIEKKKSFNDINLTIDRESIFSILKRRTNEMHSLSLSFFLTILRSRELDNSWVKYFEEKEYAALYIRTSLFSMLLNSEYWATI